MRMSVVLTMLVFAGCNSGSSESHSQTARPAGTTRTTSPPERSGVVESQSVSATSTKAMNAIVAPAPIGRPAKVDNSREVIAKMQNARNSISPNLKQWEKYLGEPNTAEQLADCFGIGCRHGKERAELSLLEGFLNRDETSDITSRRAGLLAQAMARSASMSDLAQKRSQELHRRLTTLVQQMRIQPDDACSLAVALKPQCYEVLVEAVQTSTVARPVVRALFIDWDNDGVSVLPTSLSSLQKQRLLEYAQAQGWLSEAQVLAARDKALNDLGIDSTPKQIQLLLGINGREPARELILTTDPTWLGRCKEKLANLNSKSLGGSR